MKQKKDRSTREDDLFLEDTGSGKKHRHRREAPEHAERDILPSLVVMGVLAALVVILAFYVMEMTHAGGTGIVTNVDASGRLTYGTATPIPTAQPTPQPIATEAPTAAPKPTDTLEPAETADGQPAPQPTPEPNAAKAGMLGLSSAQIGLSVSGTTPPSQRAGDYLPVIKRGETDEKVVAITVDDCFQIENLKELIALTYEQGGKLTLFPIGENVLRTGMAEVLRDAVFAKGFEIENHTYSHDRVFRMEEEDACRAIWKQTAAVSYVLGVDYKQHFYRFMGGDGEDCQRTNVYLKQLGFKAIAHWTWSGSDATLEQSEAQLKPGMIYLFHTTNRDTAILRDFIPYCIEQGYRLVTLNELLGYEPNETGDITDFDRTCPKERDFDWDYADLAKGNYSWRTVMLQRALYEQGYLGDEAKTEDGGFSGYYGAKTEEAVKAYQGANGITATGVADWQVQAMLLG